MSEVPCGTPRQDNSTQCAQHATSPRRTKDENKRYFLAIAAVAIKQALLPLEADIAMIQQ
jgi:hypothetical protein